MKKKDLKNLLTELADDSSKPISEIREELREVKTKTLQAQMNAIINAPNLKVRVMMRELAERL